MSTEGEVLTAAAAAPAPGEQAGMPHGCDDAAMTLHRTVGAMTPFHVPERERLLIARAEHHERVATQIRRIVRLVADKGLRDFWL